MTRAASPAYIRAPAPPWACLGLCIVFAAIALLAAAFEWTLIDSFPALMFMPGHLVVSLAPLVGGTIWAAAELRRVRRGGWWHAAPFAVCVATLLALQYLPFTRIWLDANFWWHRTEREPIVRQVEDGTLEPNVAHNGSLIALGDKTGKVSAGDNDIMIETRAGKPWVLFFTFRGINHYSGFLHMPDGGDPETFADLSERRHQIVQYAAGWYFVAR
jgi:hypothetical protein